MIKIDVFIQNKNWKQYISNPSRYIKSKAKLINSSLKFIKNKKINFSILLAGSKEVKILNKKFRKKNKEYWRPIISFLYSYRYKKVKK